MRTLLIGALLAAALLATSGCSALIDDIKDRLTAPTATQTGEQYCGTLPQVNGKLFFCGTVQANLQNVPSPNQGYCMSAASPNSLGLVGYSAVTFAGGADLVRSMIDATDTCNNLNVGTLRQCGSVIRCTRAQ
jgi:hypothetical protein